MEVYEWIPHDTEECRVSTKISNYYTHSYIGLPTSCGTGQTTEGRGRPKGFSPVAAIQHTQTIAAETTGENSTCDTESCAVGQCPLCCNVLDRPLELASGEVVCVLQVGITQQHSELSVL